jgi:hypothetical protein
MIGRLRRGKVPIPVEEPEPGKEDWEAFGIDQGEASGWDALGFDAFDAALAHGDGFTPSFAVHYREQLLKTADSWRRMGLNSTEGLRWHRAGFAVKEATRWRSLRVNVEAARGLRDGYYQSRETIGGQHDPSKTPSTLDDGSDDGAP